VREVIMPLIRLHEFFADSFAHSERISGSLLLGLLVILAISFGTWLRRQVRKSWLGGATQTRSGWLSTCALVARLAALLLVGIAAADPRLGRGTSDAGRSSEQIVLLMDSSRSMLAADAEPTRFALARRLAADVIDRAEGAAIAIVSFAGDARIESPLSRDYGQLRERLEALEPGQDARSGTLLAQGLKLGAGCFASQCVGPKRLIVVTDGETHGPVSLDGVTMPKGASVLLLGVGDSINGARIPLKSGQNDGLPDAPQYFTYEGKTVWTKSQPENLQDLARRLNGQSCMVTSLAEGSGIISAARGDVRKSLRWERLATATPIYSPLLYAALVLLVLESLPAVIDRLGWYSGSRRRDRHTTIAIALLAILGSCFVSGASPRPENKAEVPADSRRQNAETYNRGVKAYQSAAWQEAEAQFRRAMESGEEPISSQASFNLANAQYQWVRKAGMSKQEAISRLEECIACYRRSIQEKQRPADARANLQIVYALLKHIENQEPTNRQSSGDDKDESSANPPPRSGNRRAERGQGDKPRQSLKKASPNSSGGDASKIEKPGQTAMSAPQDMGAPQDKLTGSAAEDELRRIRDQARRRGRGKEDVMAGPTVPGGLPW
jgi:Ca-activated chloride channel family protein